MAEIAVAMFDVDEIVAAGLRTLGGNDIVPDQPLDFIVADHRPLLRVAEFAVEQRVIIGDDRFEFGVVVRFAEAPRMSELEPDHQAIVVADRFLRIAYSVIRSLELQKENITFLGNRCYTMTYEDFVSNPENHIVGLKQFLPELSDLSFNIPINIPNVVYSTISDIVIDSNEQIIADLNKYPGAYNKVSEYFNKHEDIIKSWGYNRSSMR